MKFMVTAAEQTKVVVLAVLAVANKPLHHLRSNSGWARFSRRGEALATMQKTVPELVPRGGRAPGLMA